VVAGEGSSFGFGLEAEFMLVDAGSYRPLWYRDLKFQDLNRILELINYDDLPPLKGLELEPPHTRLSPVIVEGYHLPDPQFNPIDLLPKGVEIRTPVCSSIQECLHSLKVLHERLQKALEPAGYRAVVLSHHPCQYKFEGPQNKRRYDYWRWSMEAMTTYGPDINVSLPEKMRSSINVQELHDKVNYYGPAITALTLGSPFRGGLLWRIRGRVGKSLRTYKRSVFGQIIELHPEENGRMEFKTFEMTNDLEVFHAYFLLWLELLLDDSLEGRASYQSRIYDLGRIAYEGLDDETVVPRASEVIERAFEFLPSQGFDPAALKTMSNRLVSRRLPADELIETFQREGSIEAVLRRQTELIVPASYLEKGI
jgi:hypothetical protein